MSRKQKLQIALATGILSLLLTSFWLMYRFYEQKQSATKRTTEKATSTTKLVSLESFDSPEKGLAFFENKGQIQWQQHDIRYTIESNGVKCFLKPDGIVYVFSKAAKKQKSDIASDGSNHDQEIQLETDLLALSWKGANPDVRIRAEDRALEVRNYYTTGMPQGITGVKSYRKIIYEELYQNIDLVLYSYDDQLKYDFVVKPGGNVKDIQLSYTGNEDLLLNDKGELVIEGKLGTLKEGKPYTYQTTNGTEMEITSKYLIKGGTVSFEVGKYDQNQDLIIDPTLLWATYYGGTSNDEGLAVCTDHLGNVYIAGKTHSWASIASYPVHDGSLNGEFDALLVKFDASGNRLWATYYGGNRRDAGQAVCTDPSGNVIMAGYTESSTDIADLGHDNIYNENGDPFGTRFDRDAFLVKFTKDGQRVWGTYYGGEDERVEEATGVCSDASGKIFLTGFTSSTTGIAYNGHDNTQSGSYDAFLVKFSNWGERQWATYFGKTEDDRANAICADAWGNLYIAGYTQSSNLVSGGHDGAYAGNKDAFLAKFSNNGTYYWSTYYGGTDYDEAFGVDTDASGNVYLAGVTKSNSSIAHNGHDNTINGNWDAFLVRFTLLGIRQWGTYYGGTGSEFKTAVSVSHNNDVYLAGMTSSQTGIATNNGYDPTYNNGGNDGYLVRFNQLGQRQWGSYYGGPGIDHIDDVTIDISGKVYMVGQSQSNSGIAYNGYQNSINGGWDAILAKFNPYQTGGGPGGPGDEGGLSNGSPARNGRVSGEAGTTPATPTVSIYPNPATETLQIQVQNGSETSAYLEVFTMAGQKIYEASLNRPSALSIDVRQWSKGMYILKTHTLSGVSSEKVVIQ